MISAATQTEVDRLRQLQNTYLPSDDIRAVLQHKSLVMLVGATCQGKSTVIQAATTLDQRFGMAGNLTTRPPREDDGTLYTYYDYTDEGLQKLFTKIENHELVQYAFNTTGHIYGSELAHYSYEYNLKDVLASAVDSFRRLGFGSTKAVTVISDPGAWLARFNDRFPPGNIYRVARRDEAIQSFMWSLAQPSGTHGWVENIDGQPEKAGQTVIDIALNNGTDDSHARALAEQSLAIAHGITAE